MALSLSSLRSPVLPVRAKAVARAQPLLVRAAQMPARHAQPTRRNPDVLMRATSPANHPEYDSEHNMLTKTIVGEELTFVFYLAFVMLMLLPVWFPPAILPIKHLFENVLHM